MRRILVVIFLGIFAFSATAQDLKQANDAFNKGKYTDAKRLYETAASLMKDASERNKVYDLAKSCTKCQNKLDEANKFYQNRQYQSALKAYKELLTLNPKDPTARSRNIQIPQMIEKERLDDRMWGEISQDPSYEKYKEYVDEFPNGKHVADARSYIKTIDEQRKAQEEADARERERLENLRKQEEEAYRAFANSKQVQSGVDYLKQYPDGEYVAQVKDQLVDLYCDRHEYSKARQYAASVGKKVFVENHEREYEREKNAEAEARAFAQFNKNRTEAAAQSFLQKYRNGYHAEEVSSWLVDVLCNSSNFVQARQYAVNDELKRLVESKEDDYAFERLRKSRSLSGEEDYLVSHPSGKYVEDVKDWYVEDLIKANDFVKARQYATSAKHRAQIDQAEEKQDYNEFKARPSLFWGKEYLEKYPEGPHHMEVREWVVKNLCDNGDYTTAARYAAPSNRLVNYVNSEKEALMRAQAAERKKTERAEAFDEFATHFLDATIGFDEGEIASLGAIYACVPKRLGFYLGGEMIYDSYSAFAGPVFRLTKDSSGVDLQLYGGVGVNSDIPLDFSGSNFSEFPLIIDAGVRLGIRQTKFSVIDLCAGARIYEGTPVYYAGVSIAFPFFFLLAL